MQSIMDVKMAGQSGKTCAVEPRCVIKYLVKERVIPAEIFRRLTLQLGDACPPRQDVYKWCDKFIKGQESGVEKEKRSSAKAATVLTITKKAGFKPCGADNANTRTHPETRGTLVRKVVPNSTGNTTKSSTHQIQQVLKPAPSSSKTPIAITRAAKEQLNTLQLKIPISKSKMETQNFFANLKIHQSLKSNPLLQGLAKCSTVDKAKETQKTKTEQSCSSSCNSTSSKNTNSGGSKTAHSTCSSPKSPGSSVIISSPFKHLMVGPKISNQPSPFHKTVNNNTSKSPGQQTPVNTNGEKNCKILFHSGKGVSPIAAQAGSENTNNPNFGSASAPPVSRRKINFDNMDPEKVALIKQRRRDKKFKKLQELSALMRAPDDRHSMGPLRALKRELAPNRILGFLSSKLSSLSSNPFNRTSFGNSNRINQLTGSNPWKGDNMKKTCSFFHEPSLKNSTINNQGSPQNRSDNQRDPNTPPTEPVREIRPRLSASSVIDNALRKAALKFITNEMKDKDSNKDATPISAEIFGSNKLNTPNLFLQPPREDHYRQGATSPSPSDDNNARDDSSPNNKANNSWSSEDNESRRSSKAAARSPTKSNKRKTKLKRKRPSSGSSSENHSTTRSLKRTAENLSDGNESPTKENERNYSENKRSRVSNGAKEKDIPKRRGRPPLPGKLKALKNKRRGRPPIIGAIKAKLQKRGVKTRGTYNKRKMGSAQPKINKRRGRPRKDADDTPPPEPKSKTEVSKLTDEELKVKLKIPRKRGRPSKAEAMLREMAAARLAEAKKDNIGLGLTIRPRPARKQSSASRHNRQPQSTEDTEQVTANKRIKLEPISTGESTSGADVAKSANDLQKNVKVETNTDISNLTADAESTYFDKGQRKKKPFRKNFKNDPDYNNGRRKSGSNESEGAESTDNTTKEDTADENEEVPANRSRPLLTRNVKKNSKPIPTFTDSEESDGDADESKDEEYMEYKEKLVPKPRAPITKMQITRMPIQKMPIMKPPMKIIRPVNQVTGQMMPPIYNVPRVLLPPSIQDTGIPCKMCGKVHTQDHFFKYMELKSTTQPHRCPLCGQYFTWSCLFIEHMRSHPENTAQYRCEYCNAVSRKISAYFNCRITHSPPSKEWLELQKTCDDYLASLNEAKEKKNPRYNRNMNMNRFVRPLVGNVPTPMNKPFMMNTNLAKDKNIQFPKIVTPINKAIKTEVMAAAATTTTTTTMMTANTPQPTTTTTSTETKNYIVNRNEPKDRKGARCSARVTPNKVIQPEVSSVTTPEVKDTQDKSPTGRNKGREAGRKNATSKKPFACKVCKKTFLTFDFLTKHKQLHKSKRPYSCKKCGKRFATRAYFTVHKRTYHAESDKTFVCEVCGLIFSFVSAYTNHVERLQHLTDEEHRRHSLQPHVCDICQRGFKIKQSLVNHMRTHTGERPFICEVCNKGFTQTGSLDRHRRIHQRDVTPSAREKTTGRQDATPSAREKTTGRQDTTPSPREKITGRQDATPSREKTPGRQNSRFRCKPCRKYFTNEGRYQNHMQTHNEEKFYCDFCEQTFATAHLLKSHKHNEQRPFKCKNCGRCYKLKQSLQEHKRVCN